jgi:hypothetical protein
MSSPLIHNSLPGINPRKIIRNVEEDSHPRVFNIILVIISTGKKKRTNLTAKRK